MKWLVVAVAQKTRTNDRNYYIYIYNVGKHAQMKHTQMHHTYTQLYPVTCLGASRATLGD